MSERVSEKGARQCRGMIWGNGGDEDVVYDQVCFSASVSWRVARNSTALCTLVLLRTLRQPHTLCSRARMQCM